MKIVILAGGAGTRLWPISRERYPKQLQSIIGNQTLLRQTYKRALRIASKRDILIATGAGHAAEVARQLPSLPKENIIKEPVRRDSASAIGLACAIIAADNPDEIIFSMHADAWIKNEHSFVAATAAIGPALARFPDHTILFGIRPAYPETGYGYIQVNTKRVQQKPAPIYAVRRFIEKPDLERAKRFVKDAHYYWNPGWFAWKAGALLDLYKTHLPKHYAILSRIARAAGSERAALIKKEFPKLASVSIDRGILERTAKRLAIPTDIEWSDIGHWRSVSEMAAKDRQGNTVHGGGSVLMDTSDSYFSTSSKKLVAAIGVRNLVMVETEDVILLADKGRAQEVKAAVEELKKRNKKKYV